VSNTQIKRGLQVKRFILTAVVTAALTASTAASAQAGGPVDLKSFKGGQAKVEVQGNTAALLTVPTGGWAGVYMKSDPTRGQALEDVDFTFKWTGAMSGGSPRWSVAVDENADGDTDGYAFIDAANAGGVSPVTTTSAFVPLWYKDVRYDNWDAFYTANGGFQTSMDPSFIIADAAGQVAITDIAYALNVS
jgi:hypothetical protein